MVGKPNESRPPVQAPVHGGRVTIPISFIKELGWASNLPAEVWLLMTSLGRFRLVSGEDVQGTAMLKSIVEQTAIDATRKAGVLETEEAATTTIGARLVRTTISPPPSSWRLHIPLSVFDLGGEDVSRDKVYILLRLGFLEVWTVQEMMRSLRVPIEQAFLDG